MALTRQAFNGVNCIANYSYVDDNQVNNDKNDNDQTYLD